MVYTTCRMWLHKQSESHTYFIKVFENVLKRCPKFFPFPLNGNLTKEKTNIKSKNAHVIKIRCPNTERSWFLLFKLHELSMSIEEFSVVKSIEVKALNSTLNLISKIMNLKTLKLMSYLIYELISVLTVWFTGSEVQITWFFWVFWLPFSLDTAKFLYISRSLGSCYDIMVSVWWILRF